MIVETERAIGIIGARSLVDKIEPVLIAIKGIQITELSEKDVEDKTLPIRREGLDFLSPKLAENVADLLNSMPDDLKLIDLWSRHSTENPEAVARWCDFREHFSPSQKAMLTHTMQILLTELGFIYGRARMTLQEVSNEIEQDSEYLNRMNSRRSEFVKAAFRRHQVS